LAAPVPDKNFRRFGQGADGFAVDGEHLTHGGVFKPAARLAHTAAEMGA